MRTNRFIRSAVIVTSLTLIPWLPVSRTHAAEQPPRVGTPSQEISETITDAQPSVPSAAPVMGGAPTQVTWVDDIMDALDTHFKANYPTVDFAPYLKKLTLVRDAVERGDRRTVKVEMSMFFTMLADRDDGMSKVAADELANFAVVVMQVQEYGPEAYGTTIPRSGAE